MVRGHLHTASLSIGITVSGAGHDHPDEVLREADLALLRAKRRGRARIEMYDPTQDKPVTVHELELEHSLRSALADNRGLVPYFQPIVGLLDRRRGRLRGAGPVGARRAGPARSGRLPADGRADRPDRAARLVDAGRLLPGCRRYRG